MKKLDWCELHEVMNIEEVKEQVPVEYIAALYTAKALFDRDHAFLVMFMFMLNNYNTLKAVEHLMGFQKVTEMAEYLYHGIDEKDLQALAALLMSAEGADEMAGKM